ncbi:MAG: SpoVT/AbrB protein [uncultured bacterium]|nr:MAG: SpoVT/AbrB protein [uncultured bacterium]
MMKIAKIFKSGNSQALRLPKEFQFQTKEVEIFKQGNNVILREKPKNLKHAFELLTSMPNDFYSCEREDSFPQEREFF